MLKFLLYKKTTLLVMRPLNQIKNCKLDMEEFHYLNMDFVLINLKMNIYNYIALIIKEVMDI